MKPQTDGALFVKAISLGFVFACLCFRTALHRRRSLSQQMLDMSYAAMDYLPQMYEEEEMFVRESLPYSKDYLKGTNQKVPFLLGAGQGTTGTHALFFATCKVGVPSVHFWAQCGPKNITQEVMDGFHEHLMLVKKSRLLGRHCWKSNSEKCRFDRLPEFVEEMKDHITGVLHSGINAAHDSPYTFFLDHTLKQTKDIRGELRLVTSERDPSVWAKKRVSDHVFQFVCKEYFDFDVPERKDLGALDIPRCLKLAQKRDPQPKFMNEVFTTYAALNEWVGTNETKAFQTYRNNIMAVTHYQKLIRSMSPSYIINMWERETRVDIDDLGKEIMEAVNRDNKYDLSLAGKFMRYNRGTSNKRVGKKLTGKAHGGHGHL
eukprot:CAMPEP_0194047606 /NCGR_PEP_ID=MMETSP0009_2-20130614/25067_1 /TAXON_ID=210454 /ORGANISM="Grammatophora oceanica, Strain CCMP 410" /LENGTH=374 /DNA_ID=CAMNT_0038693269 /DNA_START=114 /DNA_END=1238 /DNA_ORIENTATION=-